MKNYLGLLAFPRECHANMLTSPGWHMRCASDWNSAGAMSNDQANPNQAAALLTFTLVGGFIQDGLGRHNFAISVRTKKINKKQGSMAASRVVGSLSVHFSLPTCPQAAYRCTHEYLLCQWRIRRQFVCPHPVRKRVPLRSLQQTALPGQTYSASGPLLRYSGIFLPSPVLSSCRPKRLNCNEDGL